ncbi:MAG TPA: glycosyltransferase, partial [Proteobacteria bacterium]|nr:glycosyltransferase [Pseudomonadota bacterium]
YFSMHHEKNLDCIEEAEFISRIDFESPGGIKEKLSQSLKLLYSFEARKKIDSLLKREKPDLAHLHSIYHQISPSIIHSLKKHGIPIVMTLHDYKMVCPAYSMVRRGQVCEECKGGRYYRCLFNRCTKESYAKSMLNAIEMYLHHRILSIYGSVDVFITPSRFMLNKLKGMGFRGFLVNLTYSLDPRECRPEYVSDNRTICYFGRLSSEKGIYTLFQAIKGLNVNLKVIGAGPAESALRARAREEGMTNVRFLGYLAGDALKDEVKRSSMVIVPSEWYENYPNSVMEAFALGKPVIGARIGGIPEMVKDGETGFTFSSGNADELRSKIRLLLDKPGLIIKLGKNARRFIEEELNPDRHYRELMKIYQTAKERRSLSALRNH